MTCALSCACFIKLLAYVWIYVYKYVNDATTHKGQRRFLSAHATEWSTKCYKYVYRSSVYYRGSMLMPSPPPQALHYSNTDPPPFPKHINTSHRKLQNNFIKQSLPNNSSLKNTFNNRKPFANLNSNHLQLQPSFTKPYRKPNPQPQPQPRLGPKSPVFSSPAGRCRRAAAARCSASWPPSEA